MWILFYFIFEIYNNNYFARMYYGIPLVDFKRGCDYDPFFGFDSQLECHGWLPLAIYNHLYS